MWKYVQATGEMFGPDGREAGRGYAGRGPSKNKPEDQCRVNEGPLPRNTYTIEPAITHSRLGPVALPLTPHHASAMCGRSAFYVHGDSTANPGNASDGCIILARAVRERMNESADKELVVVARADAVSADAASFAPGARAGAGAALAEAQVPVALSRLVVPGGLVILAAVLAGAVSARDIPLPALALYGGWLLCAIAAVAIVHAVRAPLKNEVGRDDAAHLFTIAWFVLLTSGMAAGSLWNVFVQAPGAPTLKAFVAVPASVWILGGITLLSNLGVRASFAASDKPEKYFVQPSPNRVAALMTTPLDDDGSAKMTAAQYVVFNLVALIVYGVAIARRFWAVTGQGEVGAFPEIPAEILGLMAVSGAGLVTSSAVPLLRR